MNAQELDKLITETIERNDLHGRSFTQAVGFITLVRGDYFWTDDGSVEDIEWQLAEAVAAQLDADVMKVHNTLTLKQLVEVADIAVIDDIITSYLDGEEEA